MPVNTPHPDFNAFKAKWKRCRDTFDGQDAVKAARTEYLPMLGGQDGGSDETTYSAYLFRAQFFNAVAPTVVALTGAVFIKPATKENIPKSVEDVLDDVTLSGQNLEQFARDLVGQVVSPGRAGVLVDMPATGGSRPYWVSYRAEQIINWRGVVIDGQKITTMVVLREKQATPSVEDEFVPVLSDNYRVVRLNAQGVCQHNVWRQDPQDKEKWIEGPPLIPTRRGDPLRFIPFVFVGPEGIEDKISDPPLMALVDTNLAHYLTMADLKWGEHFTAIPTPVISGVSSDAAIHLGGTKAILLTDPNAKASFLEFSGSGLSSLRESEKEQRTMMASLGGRLLENTGEAETATAVRLRHSGEHASLVGIAIACSQALSRAIQWTIWWMSVLPAVPDDATVALSTEFFPVKMSPDELAKLMAAYQAGDISFEVFFHNLLEGGIYPPGTTMEDEKARIDAEAEQRAADEEARMKAEAELANKNLPPIDDDNV